MRNFPLVALCLALLACVDDASPSDPQVDAGTTTDVSVDRSTGDLPEPDASWTSVAVELTSDFHTLDVGLTATLEARVSSPDGPIPDRTPVIFQLLQGPGWVHAEDLRAIQRATEGEQATTVFLPTQAGTARIEARVDLGGGVSASDQIDITIVDNRVDAVLSLEVDLPENLIFAAGGRRLPVTATVLGRTGSPEADARVELTASEGRFSALPDDDLEEDLAVVTDAEGEARAHYDPEAFRGFVTLDAEVQSEALGGTLRARVTIEVVDLATLTFVFSDPLSIGITGTDVAQEAVFTVKLTDMTFANIVDQPISFELDTGTDARLLTDSEITDADGQAVTAVTAGARAGPFFVVARTTIDDIEVSARSNRHFVVTTIPVSRFSAVACNPANLGGLVDVAPGESFSVTASCAGRLVDRIRQGPLVPLPVFLEAEVGSVPAQVVADESGDFEFEWVIDALPADTLPIDSRFEHEPAFDRGADSERNIRDQVARVMFYAPGEEYFEDVNGNGRWEGGEAFWDQSEPFLDSDDSGYWEEAELFADAPWGGDGRYDEGNGEWDRDTMIWGEAVVVLSGAPSFAEAPEGSDRETYSLWRHAEDIPPGGTLQLRDGQRAFIDLLLADQAGAPPNSSTSVSFELTDCGGEILLESDALVGVPDSLGFDLVSIQGPVGVGWTMRSALSNFEGGARVPVEIVNPTRGNPAECVLRALVQYAGCPTCDDANESEAVLNLTAE